MSLLQLEEISIQVRRRKMKNVYLRVLADGSVVLSAPKTKSKKDLLSFAQSKITWIRASQTKMREKYNLSPKQFVDDELHWVFGERYRLKVLDGRPRTLLDEEHLTIYCHKAASLNAKQNQIEKYYRSILDQHIPQILTHWTDQMNLPLCTYKIRKMKARWGSCYYHRNAITLNLELAKRPIELLEYVIIHELCHLFEKNHNRRFYQLMTKYLPHWQDLDKSLNELPIGA